MPSILLDHHIDEAAMRPTSKAVRHRWSRRRTPTVAVANVVTAATIHAPAARHLQGVKRLDSAPLDFSDLLDTPDTCPDWAVPQTIEENIAAIRGIVERAPFVRHEPAAATALAHLAALLDEPTPATDWQYVLDNAEAREIDRHLTWRAASARELDAWYNATLRDFWTTTAEVIFPARELGEQLVDDVAASIMAGVSS